jgi:hypothetical protein
VGATRKGGKENTPVPVVMETIVLRMVAIRKIHYSVCYGLWKAIYPNQA